MQLSPINTEDQSHNKNLRCIRFDKITVDFSSFGPDLYIPLALFRSPHVIITPSETKQWNPSKNLFICVNKNFAQTFVKKSKEEKGKAVCTYEYKIVYKRETHITITKHDMSKLYPNVCLNDNIVNFYLKCLVDYFILSNNKIYITNSNWYPLHYKNINNQEQIKNTGNKFTIFNYDVLITPINENYHWTLVIINNFAKMRNILEYDDCGTT